MTRPTINPKLPDYWDHPGPRLRLGVCQVRTERWDLDGNTERLLDSVREAAGAGAELAVTPECVFHGYGMLDDRHGMDEARAAAETVDGPRMTRVRALVAELGLHLVVGFAEAGEDGRIHNSAALIGPDGGVRSIYRKVHLREFEAADGSGYFSPGDSFEVVSVQTGAATIKMGTMICFDREFPETVRALRSLGAQLVPCPLATNTSRFDAHHGYGHDELITQARAAENQLFIAVVNHAGRINGGSFIVGPGGELVVQLGTEPEVRVVDLPIGAIVDLRADRYAWKAWEFRRPEVYRRYL